jgi:hypothetical protein
MGSMLLRSVLCAILLWALALAVAQAQTVPEGEEVLPPLDESYRYEDTGTVEESVVEEAPVEEESVDESVTEEEPF